MNPIILSIPIFFILIAIEVIYSLATKKNYYRSADTFSNIGCGIFEQTTGLFVKVFTIGIYTLAYQYRIFDIPSTWPFLILLFLGIDFQYYWAHRLSHQINLLWIGHVIHHQSESYNLSVALRQGALQKFFTSPFALPLAFLGFDPYWFLYLSAINTLYQFWIHTEAIDKMGWLEKVFNTPSHHRVHHGRDPKYIDKNHAGSLIIWDKMFGTFQEEQERPHYGITKPTETFNPVMAHIRPIQQLWDDVKQVSGWDKARLLFKGPGWFPESSGGPKSPPEIPVDYKVYDVVVPRVLNFYSLVQFVLTIGYVAGFLFTYADLSTQQQLTGALWIVVALIALGSLFQKSKGFVVWELLRWIFLFYILSEMYNNTPIYYLTMALGAISIAFLLWSENKISPDENE